MIPTGFMDQSGSMTQDGLLLPGAVTQMSSAGVQLVAHGI